MCFYLIKYRNKLWLPYAYKKWEFIVFIYPLPFWIVGFFLVIHCIINTFLIIVFDVIWVFIKNIIKKIFTKKKKYRW